MVMVVTKNRFASQPFSFEVGRQMSFTRLSSVFDIPPVTSSCRHKRDVSRSYQRPLVIAEKLVEKKQFPDFRLSLA